MRGLWKRGGVWWAVVPIPGGGRVRRSLQTDDLPTAIAEAKKLRQMALNGDLQRRDAGMDGIVDGWVASMRARGISPRWSEDGAYTVKAALKRMAVTSMTQIDTPGVRRWFEAECTRTSPHTAAMYLRRLSGFCQWASETGRLRGNPCQAIKPQKAPPRLRKSFLTRQEAQRMIDECEDDGLKFALYCALHAGLRRGEISAARPDWFDLDSRLLHVQNTADFTIKDRDDRTIPLTNEFVAFLKRYGLRSPYMLEPGVKVGKSRYRFDIQKRWEAHRRKMGMEHFTFHDLRRTFASLLVSAGVSIYKVAKWLGDGVEVVEQRYGHLTPQDDEINAAWTAKPSPKRSRS